MHRVRHFNASYLGRSRHILPILCACRSLISHKYLFRIPFSFRFRSVFIRFRFALQTDGILWGTETESAKGVGSHQQTDNKTDDCGLLTAIASSTDELNRITDQKRAAALAERISKRQHLFQHGRQLSEEAYLCQNRCF